MSWRNIRLNLNWGQGCQCDIANFTLLELTGWSGITLGNYIIAPSGTNNQYNIGTMFGYNPNYVSGEKTGTNLKSCKCHVFTSGGNWTYGNDFIDDTHLWGFVAAVDDDAQKGFFAIAIRNTNNNSVNWMAGSQPPTANDIKRNYIYTLLTGNEHIEYSWRCLSAISGEFGQINLAQIKQDRLNNGEEVTNADISYFNSFPETSKAENICGDPEKKYLLESNGKPEDSLEFVPIRRMTGKFISGTGDLITCAKKDDTGAGIYAEAFYTSNFLAVLIDDEHHMAKPSPIRWVTLTNTYDYNYLTFTNEEMENFYNFFIGDYDPNQNNSDTGEPGEWTPRIDEPIDAPTTPTTSAIDTGFTTMYKIDDTELKKLSEFLWSDNFIDVVNKFFDDPSQAIVGLSMFPVSPDVGGSETIMPGGVATPASGYPLTSQYKDVPIGTIYMNPAGNSFLDFTPYTRVSIVLPYCGEHALDCNDIIGKTLELHYVFDFLSGGVLAYILVNGSLHYTFAGQCAVPIPTSQRTYDSIISGVISTGAAFGGLLATAASGGLTSAVPLTALSASALNQMNIHPEIQYSSGGGGITGFLSNQKPFLKIEEPIPKLAPNQHRYVGRPTYNKYKIDDLSGYCKYMSIHLDNVICTEKEKQDIENYLLNGFIKRSYTTYPTISPVTSGNTAIAFFVNKSDRNVLGKDVDVTEGHYEVIEGKLVVDWSILTPKIIIKGDVSNYNYCYIPNLNRFYFIDDIMLRANGMQELTLSIDSLETYRDQIKECSGVVERQQTKTNKYFGDSYYWTQSNKRIVTWGFKGGTSIFDRNSNCYILTIAGNVTSS